MSENKNLYIGYSAQTEWKKLEALRELKSLVSAYEDDIRSYLVSILVSAEMKQREFLNEFLEALDNRRRE